MRILQYKCIDSNAKNPWSWKDAIRLLNLEANENFEETQSPSISIWVKNHDKFIRNFAIDHDMILRFEKKQIQDNAPYGRHRGNSSRRTQFPPHEETDEYKSYIQKLPPAPVEPPFHSGVPSYYFGAPNSFDDALRESRRAQENRQRQMGGE